MAEPNRRPVTPDDGPDTWRSRHGDAIRRAFRRKLPPDAVAEMNGDFWAKVQVKRAQIPAGNRRATRAYLLRMARRMIADYYGDRAHRNRQTAAARELAKRSSPQRDPTVGEAIRNEEGDPLDRLHKALHEAIALLPPEWRHAIEMKYWAKTPKTGWSQDAGIHRKTAKEWEDKAKRRLRELLGDDFPDDLMT